LPQMPQHHWLTFTQPGLVARGRATNGVGIQWVLAIAR
jgi:hypothetical protein